MFQPPKQQLWNYIVAIALVSIALLLMLILDPLIQVAQTSFLLFFGAATLSAWYGGQGAGILATLLSALCANYFLIEPQYSLYFTFASGSRTAIFILQGCLISILVSSRQPLRTIAQDINASKQDEVLQKRAELMLLEQTRLLEIIATGCSLDRCLTDICTSISQLSSQTRACFLLADTQRQTFPRSITPNFPSSFGMGLKDAPINDLCIGTCGEAVYRGEQITCADIANDDRWSQTWRDLCIAHGILACHSQPVMGVDGLPLGSLMLCFNQARQPTEWEYELAQFGAQVASIVFERTQTEENLRLNRDRLAFVLQATGIGLWLNPLPLQELNWDEKTRELFYLPPEIEPTIELFWSRLHPDDREATRLAVETALRDRTLYQIDHRTIDPNTQEIRWIRSAGKATYAPDGTPIRFDGINYDISDRKQAEVAWRQSEEQLRLATEGANLGMWYWDVETDQLTWTDRAKAMFGLSADTEMSMQVFLEAVHPDDRPLIDNILQDLEAGKSHTEDEYRTLWLDGTVRWILARGDYTYDSEGKLISTRGVLLDITERKQATAALAENEARLRGFVEANVVGILYGDIYGNIRESNDELLRIVGYTREDLYSGRLRWIDITPPEHLPLDEEAIAQARATGACTPYEKDYIHQDGSRVPVLIGYSLVGETREESVAFVLDLSDRKRAEAALRESEQRLQTIIDNSTAAIYMKDVEGRYLLINRECERLFHITNDEIYRKTDYDIFPQETADALRLNDRQVLDSGTAVTLEEAIPLDDGIHTYIAVKFILSDRTGVPYAICGISTDISDRVRLEAERDRLLEREQAARAEAERANRVKDEFLAIVSHELRTPLNPILGWSKLLQSQRLDAAKTTQALSTIARNAKLQAELIEDLLDVSRILRGKLSLNTKPVYLGATIQAAIETVRLAAEAKSIQIQVVFEPKVKPVLGDAARLQQVIWNLLSNAVKFTPPEGQVWVRLAQLDNQVQITVSDTGKGIDPKFLPYVFDYFRQEDGATTRKFGGLGLGLAIVHHLVELHGGTVQAESSGEGQGATFTVQIPSIPSPTPTNFEPASTSSSYDLKGLRVLAIDDEIDSRDFVAFVLEQAGASVITAATATEGFLALTQFLPDVLLSDIGMPDLDGYMLMRQVRALPPEQGGAVKAIALTAYAGDFNRQQALQAGFQQHVSKPVEPEVLVKAIARLCGQSGEEVI
jgi:PAS domain S-box-containing protein